VLEPTRQAVLQRYKELAGRIENVEPILRALAGHQFYNTSPLTFTGLLNDPNTIADSLHLCIGGFSEAAKDVIDKFDFGIQIDRLRKANILDQVLGKFARRPIFPLTPRHKTARCKDLARK
jgi:type I restriction enzyme M protein